MEGVQQNSPDTVCVRCGSEANWHFLDEATQTVEIICPIAAVSKSLEPSSNKPNSISLRPKNAGNEGPVARQRTCSSFSASRIEAIPRRNRSAWFRSALARVSNHSAIS